MQNRANFDLSSQKSRRKHKIKVSLQTVTQLFKGNAIFQIKEEKKTMFIFEIFVFLFTKV